MHRNVRAALLAAALLAIVAGAAGAARSEGGGGGGFEVWAVDQSNTTGTTSGGAIHVYDGTDLAGARAATAVSQRIDLGAATTALCLAQTGSAPVRPHMVFFNAG